MICALLCTVFLFISLFLAVYVCQFIALYFYPCGEQMSLLCNISWSSVCVHLKRFTMAKKKRREKTASYAAQVKRLKVRTLVILLLRAYMQKYRTLLREFIIKYH